MLVLYVRKNAFRIPKPGPIFNPLEHDLPDPKQQPGREEHCS